MLPTHSHSMFISSSIHILFRFLIRQINNVIFIMYASIKHFKWQTSQNFRHDILHDTISWISFSSLVENEINTRMRKYYASFSVSLLKNSQDSRYLYLHKIRCIVGVIFRHIEVRDLFILMLPSSWLVKVY